MNIESKHFKWTVIDGNGWGPGSEYFGISISRPELRELNIDILENNAYNDNLRFSLHLFIKGDFGESVYCEYLNSKKLLTIDKLEFNCSFKQADRIVWKLFKGDRYIKLEIPPIHKK